MRIVCVLRGLPRQCRRHEGETRRRMLRGTIKSTSRGETVSQRAVLH